MQILMTNLPLTGISEKIVGLSLRLDDISFMVSKKEILLREEKRST